ncbi:hypothetical protein GC194_08050 [bacterium]|nr:hypothetical protein [bacterium]
MKNRKLIKLALNATAVLLLFLAVSFANRKVAENQVNELKVEIDETPQGQFISEIDVVDRLNDFYAPGLNGQHVRDLQLTQLDSLIESSPFVRQANSFANLQGQLYISVAQEVPVLRIINSKKSGYYLNEQGKKMPLSVHRAARVPVATGQITEELFPTDSFTTQTLKDLYSIAQYLDKHPFFKAITGQLFVEPNGDIVLITKQEERHNIVLGNAENLEEKFDNLFQFYTKVLSVKGWDTYHTINLKFKNQIVAKK